MSLQSRQIRTVGDLKQYMMIHELSPETLAHKVLLSNMTIRRMLRLNASEKISEKYWLLFDQLLEGNHEIANSQLLEISAYLSADFTSLTQSLEKSGLEMRDVNPLKEEVLSKIKDKNLGRGLKASVKMLLSTATGSNHSTSSRAIAIGALLYFLNPVDMIPDALVGVGYLDDISVASVAISAIVNNSKSTDANRKKLRKRVK